MAFVPSRSLLASLPYVKQPAGAIPVLEASAVEAEYYNTDCGNKACMGSMIAASPNRMAIMRSMAPRFPSSRTVLATPFGVYNLDTAHKKDISTKIRDSKTFYSATFNRNAKRMAPDCMSDTPDVVYDPLRTYNNEFPTLASHMENSPVRYAVMKSKQSQMSKQLRSEAPDIEYNIDCLNKASMHTTMQQSPILYANISKSKTGRSSLSMPSSCPAAIGPGTYDCPYHKDVRVSLILNQNPMSTMVSKGARLATDKVDPTKYLGSTWKLQSDEKHWKKGVQMSKAQYLRPQYLPASYADK